MRQLNTDCEGPICLNDNAFELCAHFIPHGEAFFTRVSKYDDYLALIAKKPGYKAGDTLKLIAPFLKAYDLTSDKVKEFSQKSLLFVPGAQECFSYLVNNIPTYMISTSYEQFAYAVGGRINLPWQNIYCTKINWDNYSLGDKDKKKLKMWVDEIVSLPLIEFNPEAKSLFDLEPASQEVVKRMDKIFWFEVPLLPCGKIFKDLNPIGGKEKAKAILDSLKRTGNSLKEVVYVGDSITDVEAFELVRSGGGLTISFNGNRYAVRGAEIACFSESAFPLAIIINVFFQAGKGETLELVKEWSFERIKKLRLGKIIQDFLNKENKPLSSVRIVEKNNLDELIELSEETRKKIRGEAIGALG